MPVDPQIPLATRGLGPIQTLSDSYDEVQRYKLAREQSLALAENRLAQAAERKQRLADARLASEQSMKLRALTPDQWTPDFLGPILGPEKTIDVVKGLSALQEQDIKTDAAKKALVGSVVGGLKALPGPFRAQMYGPVRKGLIDRGHFTADEIPEEYKPEYLDLVQQWALTADQQVDNAAAAAAASKPIPVSPNGMMNPTTGEIVVPAALKPKAFQSKDVLVNGKPSVANFDPASGKYFDADGGELQNVKPIPPQSSANGTTPRPLTQTAEANLIAKLAGQWTTATKSATETQRALKIMKAGVDRFEADPNGASQAVLVTFQKLLDPESVVRESEYARSSQGISALQRINGYVERLSAGGAGVPKSQLLEMVKTAEQFYDNTKGGTDGVRSRISATAKRYNIPDDLVFNDSGPAAAAPTTAAPPKAAGAFTVTAPNGTVYTFKTQAQADIFKKRAGIQ